MSDVIDPVSQPSEPPVVYADRLGRAFADADARAEERALRGQYLTPPEVALFMADLAGPVPGEPLRVLDPGAGAGVLSCAVVQSLATRSDRPSSLHLVTYENDGPMLATLRAALEHARRWAGERGLAVTFEIRPDDFVLREGPALTRADATGSPGEYGLAISNPPYVKVPKDDPRAQATQSVVHGQPNLYGFFMAISAALLSRSGEFVFITPRSFASGPYFRLFRERFFKRVRPELVHLFVSRKDAFRRDEVLQENVVLRGRRDSSWLTSMSGEARVSHSAGIGDLASRVERHVPLARMLDTRREEYVLRLPLNERDDEVLTIVDSWPGRFETYGWRISTGPVVPFRTNAVCHEGDVPRTHAPLLWMQNVRAMSAEWPAETRKGQFIRVDQDSKGLLVPNRNYVLLRRFSAKEEPRRLVAAPLLSRRLPGPVVGLENHLNYIHKPGGTLSENEAVGLAAILSSQLLDSYFRVSSGNTQVSATELRAMPLPPHNDIARLGAAILDRGLQPSPSSIEPWLEAIFAASSPAPAAAEASVRG